MNSVKLPTTVNQILIILLLLLIPATVVANEVHAEFVKSYQSGLDQPTDVAVSDDGRLYVLDGSHHRVVVLSPAGKRLYTFGKKGSDAGELNLPMALTIDGNRVYIADTGNHRIAVFELRGWFVKNLQLGKISRLTELPEPVGLIVQDKVVSWTDRRNHQLCRTDLMTKEIIRCWGKRGESKSEFQFPFHLAADRDGYLHVVDVLNGRVQVFNTRGRFFTQVSRFGISSGELYRPNGVTFADDGRMFVSDSYLGTVSIFINGRFTGLLSIDGLTARKFKSPVGLTWHKGLLYIVDAMSNRIEVFKSAAEAKGVLPTDNIQNGHRMTSRKNCDICHFSWAEATHSEQKEQDGVLPVASQDMCYSCHHGAVIDSRLTIGRNEQHPDIHHQRIPADGAATSRQDDIPDQFPLIADKQLSCGSCHTPHTAGITEADTLYESHENPWLRVLNDEGDLCQKCHLSKLDSVTDGKNPVTGVNHPVGILLKAPPFENAKGYASLEKLHDGLPDDLRNAGGSMGSQQQLLCQSCHQIHGAEGTSLLLTGFDQNELCASCHLNLHSDDKRESRFKGIHPVNIKMEEAVELGGEQVKEVTCQVCHSAHDGREDTALLTRSTENIDQLCASCHQQQHADNKKEAHEKGVHVVNAKLDEAVKMGDDEITTMSCLSCHSVHAGQPNTPALRFDHKNGELCSYCHEGNEAVVKTDHDLRVTAKKSKNKLEQIPGKAGVCGSCHSMHRANEMDKYLFSANDSVYEGKAKIFQRDQLCLNCHAKNGVAKESIVNHFSHPAKDLVLRSDPKVMPLLNEQEEIAEFGAIACITCHEPHHWQAGSKGSDEFDKIMNAKNQDGNVLNSFLRRSSIKESFCVDCHGFETPLKYKYYHDKLSRDIGIDYID